MATKFSAHQWAEDHLVYEESSTEINEGTLERLAHLLERAYAAGLSDENIARSEAQLLSRQPNYDQTFRVIRNAILEAKQTGDAKGALAVIEEAVKE